MTKSKVALIRGDDRCGSITRALDLVGERIEWASRERVLIKPNFVSTEWPVSVTHVEAVRALLQWLRVRFDGPIIVGEGTANRNTWEAFDKYGYLSLPEEFPGVGLMDLNCDNSDTVTVFDRRLRPLSLQVARSSLESDCRIAIGPPKIHDAVIITLGLKNMIMGSLISRWAPEPPQYLMPVHGRAGACPSCSGACAHGTEAGNRPAAPASLGAALTGRGLYANLPDRIKSLWLVEWIKAAYLRRSGRSDKQRMHQSLPLLNLNLFALAPLLHPHLNIIDGWVGMEGDGPTRGDAVDWQIAVVSDDFLAADALTAELMGYPIDGIGYLHYCHRAGLGAGRREEMEILGNVAPDEVRRAFRPSPTVRLQRRWQLPDVDRLLDQALRLN
jgi:uncharacterized protein (DUF362 family)